MLFDPDQFPTKKDLLTIFNQTGVMWRCALIFLVYLTACATPSQYFRREPATRISVDGSIFDVRVRGNLAEAVRINSQYAPRFGPIRGRAGFAMAQVSGCRVVEVRGDQALATGILSCKGRAPGWAVPTGTLAYSCLEVSQWVNQGPGPDYAEFECDPA